MKKFAPILLVVVLAALAVGVTYWLAPTQPVVTLPILSPEPPVADAQNQATQPPPALDTAPVSTADWKTFNDEDLKISLLYPSSCYLMGQPGGGTPGIDCYSGKYLLFEELSWQHPSFPRLSIREIAEIYRKASKEEKNPYKPTDRFIGEVSETMVNGLKAYQFSFDWDYCSNFKDDYSCDGGSAVDQKTRMVFIESDKGKKIKFILPDNDSMSQNIISTLKFIE